MAVSRMSGIGSLAALALRDLTDDVLAHRAGPALADAVCTIAFDGLRVRRSRAAR